MNCRDLAVANLVQPISSDFDCDDLIQIVCFVSQRSSLRSEVLDFCHDMVWSEVYGGIGFRSGYRIWSNQSSGDVMDGSFKAIPREAKKFELGETKYYVVLVWSAIIWQGFFLGAIGVIFCASSLLSGIVIAVLLPVTEVLAVIFYQENFQAEKGVSLVLSLWGFISYFYGEFKQNKKTKKKLILETEIPQIQNTPKTEREILNP
ncbi:hypothetical protein L484_026052 [Morus notabilis]|uniref:Purine permease 3 n=1 Tax=Morus notabilis TaxID=981085 RepID=W9RWN3_9ROSA|nr:hypothetical protein L484_026052 [Morus notabilis]